MPMIPLGLKETKDIDFLDPFKVSRLERRANSLRIIVIRDNESSSFCPLHYGRSFERRHVWIVFEVSRCPLLLSRGVLLASFRGGGILGDL